MKDNWEERAALGEALAADFEDPGVAQRLIALLLDPDDTAVTRRTAAALLALRRPGAVRLIVVASSQADDNHNDYLVGAFGEFRAETLGSVDEFLRRALISIQDDPNPALVITARELSVWTS